MMLMDYLYWSFRQCRRRLLESGLIVLAVALGVGVIVSVFALFDGIRQQQDVFVRQHHYRTVRVTAVEDFSMLFQETTSPLIAVPDRFSDEQIQFTLTDLRELQDAFRGGYVFAEQQGVYPSEMITSDNGSTPPLEVDRIQAAFEAVRRTAGTIQVTLTTPGFFAFMGFVPARGTLFLESDVTDASRVIVLGHRLAEQLFGTDDPLGRTVPLGLTNAEYTVIAVLDAIDSDMVHSDVRGGWGGGRDYTMQGFIPITAAPPAAMANVGRLVGGFTNLRQRNEVDAQTLLGREMRVGIADGRQLAAALQQLGDYIYTTYGDAVSLYAPYEVLRSQQERFALMGIVTALFASVGLIIAALNILNLMIIRVLRRTRSIGISMALGASRRAIFSQFIVEAFFMGMLGTLFGIVLSFAGVRVISQLVEQPISTSLLAQVGGVVVALAITLLFGVYPALQGASIEPASAVRAD